MGLDYPDEDLCSLQLSLAQFVTLAQALLPSELDPCQDPSVFIRFVLAGRLETPNTGSPLRVFINAKQGAFPIPVDKYQLHRDVDSVIGITQDLPFRRSLAIFPMPCFRDTLRKDNHVTYQVPGGFAVRFQQ